MSRTETGKETIDKMVEEPTLDRFYMANPLTLTDDDYIEMIKISRAQRARFVAKRETKK